MPGRGTVVEICVSKNRQSARELGTALLRCTAQRLVYCVLDGAGAELRARSIERTIIDVDKPLSHTTSIYRSTFEIYLRLNACSNSRHGVA